MVLPAEERKSERRVGIVDNASGRSDGRGVVWCAVSEDVNPQRGPNAADRDVSVLTYDDWQRTPSG